MDSMLAKNSVSARMASFTKRAFRVSLSDGRAISLPLTWFPRLRDATVRQRRQWSLVGPGVGIHWEALDEDISVESLLKPEQMIWCRGRGPTPPIVETDHRVTGLGFHKDAMTVALDDGREVSMPLEWVPGLRDATERQRGDWRLIAGGVGIHWNELDEDILVEDLLSFSLSPRPARRSTARSGGALRRPARKRATRR
jgi:hypothetical protein